MVIRSALWLITGTKKPLVSTSEAISDTDSFETTCSQCDEAIPHNKMRVFSLGSNKSVCMDCYHSSKTRG